jgi:hypothetical protein
VTFTDWVTGGIENQWKQGIPWTEWIVGFDVIGFNHLSTEYVLVPVSATKNGAPYNPTSDTVQFAFMPTATQFPGVSDWVAGQWDISSGNPIYPYNAKCLVGPGGTITLAIGTYVIYIKVTDSPEIPVLVGGQLQIQ